MKNLTNKFHMNFHGNKLSVKVVFNNHFKTGELFSVSFTYYYNDKYTGYNDCLSVKSLANKFDIQNEEELETHSIQMGIDRLYDVKNSIGQPKFIMNY